MTDRDRGRPSAPRLEGLAEGSLTEYKHGDLAHAGVKGVGGAPAVNARVRAFGAILVIEAWGSGSEIERRPLRPGLPTIDIIFIERGEFEYLEGGSWRSGLGSLLIAPSGLPHRARFLGEWRFLVARVPREALLPYVPTLEDSVGIFSDLTMPERAMRAFLTQAVGDDLAVSESESRTVDRQVLDMAGTLVLGRQGRSLPPGTPRAVLRQRSLSLIADRSGDVRFTPDALAAEVNSSLRRLQEAFAEVESTVASEIRRERARVARSLLQDPRFDGLDVGAVAARAGFGSIVSLRRALSEMYGLSPRELRNSRAD